MNVLEKLSNPPKEYRAIPFWSWNDKLDVAETKRQIALMDEAGIGGFFMHARGGLQTEFLGEEWFENIRESITEGNARGMYAWAYDENGWPSGFGNESVNGLGEEYWQKYLRCEVGSRQTDRTIAHVGKYHIYYDVNSLYVDNLNPKVVEKFIEFAYKPYVEMKERVQGMFTDEPQLSRNGIPWSMILLERYKEEYGEELISHLPELFYEIGDYKKTRLRFWRLITIQFSNSYTKQIFEYLEENGMKLTGHLVLEDDLFSQLTTNGAVMPHYEFFHIPGIDALGRKHISKSTILQVSSVAHQMGKKQVLSESFALCGDGISFEELRNLYEYQMVRGVNVLCPHLQGYTLRGLRKYDRPPAMYYQQPWWGKYSKFVDAMAAVGMLLAEGTVENNVLLIHPQSTAWIMYNDKDQDCIYELNQKFSEVIDALEEKHLLFDLGDEIIIERYAKVENGKLRINKQYYDTIVLPPHEILFDSTIRLLDEFENNGGKIIAVEDIKDESIVDNKNITYSKRVFDGFVMHYLVNSTQTSQMVNLKCKGRRLNLQNLELCPYDKQYIIPPSDSLVIIDDGIEYANKEITDERKCLSIDGNWKLVECTPNVLLLDKCDYYIDAQLVKKDQFVLDVQTDALEQKNDMNLKLLYKFNIEIIPKKLYLVTENEEAIITVNGVEVSNVNDGWFIDSSFKKIPICNMVKTGENTVALELRFHQSESTFRNIEKSYIFESTKNKLSLDTELFNLYIIGDFAVKTTEKDYMVLDKHAVRYSGEFIISERQEELSLQNLQAQGYPFFAGKMTFEKEFLLKDANYKIEIQKYGINAIDVEVNGKSLDTMMWNPYELDLSNCLVQGKNIVKLTIYNNLRNMMGPHHLKEGECFMVRPGSYFKKKWLFSYGEDIWDDQYCLMETSIMDKEEVRK